MADEDDDERRRDQDSWPRRLPRHLRRRRPPVPGWDGHPVHAPADGGEPAGEEPAGRP